jgi:hypothetical protein
MRAFNGFAAATSGESVRGLSPTSTPQRWQATQTEIAVRGLVRARLAGGESRPLPAAVWHRNELLTDAASPN